MNNQQKSLDNVIEVKDLSKDFSTNLVLKNVNLTVGKGEILALLGPNGAGKTTFLEIIEGFQKPTSGFVRVLGVDPQQGREDWLARLGIVLQSWRDHGRWKVYELLRHLESYYTLDQHRHRAYFFNASQLLKEVGLQAQRNETIRNLSGGQRRRLDVAIGLIGNPEILFLDEPTVGFDPEARRDFHRLLRKIATQYGTSIILTTHDLNEAEELAQKIAVLINGDIAAIGSPDELITQYAMEAEISYYQRGIPQHVRIARSEVNSYLFRILQSSTEIKHLQIHYASLQDFYLQLVANPSAIPKVHSTNYETAIHVN